MAEEKEGFTEEEGEVRHDVTPEDVLGALDADGPPADVDEGEGEGEQDDGEEPTGEPTGEAEGGEPTGEGEAQGEPEAGGEPPPPEAPPPEGPPAATDDDPMVLVTFKDKDGAEHDVMMKASAAKVAQAKILTADQFPGVQEKYTTLKEKLDGLQAPPGTTEGADGQPQFNQEEFERAMQPRVEEAVKVKSMSEDFAKEFPPEAAIGVWMFDTIRNVATAVHGIASNIHADAEQADRIRFRQEVFGVMGKIAGANPQAFGELAEEANRESYFKYLVEKINPTVGQLSGDAAEETLTALYAAYKAPELQAGVAAAVAKAKADQDADRLRAGGAGGGGGGRSKPAKSKHPDIDEVMDVD